MIKCKNGVVKIKGRSDEICNESAFIVFDIYEKLFEHNVKTADTYLDSLPSTIRECFNKKHKKDIDTTH